MKRIVTSTAIVILLLGGVAGALAAVERLPADVRAALEQTSNFQTVGTVSAIPESVRNTFARSVGDSSFAMADLGAKWQVTDVVIEKDLPWRRLQAGAVSPDFLVLFYEHGGIGHSYHVCVFRVTADGAELVWRAIRPMDTVNLDDLNRAIRSGAVDDDPRYMF